MFKLNILNLLICFIWIIANPQRGDFMRIIYITNVPAHYRVDFFNELGKITDLTVIFEKPKKRHRDDKWFDFNFRNFKPILLKNNGLFQDKIYFFKIFKYLKKNYDIVVIGCYSTLVGMLAINYLSKHKKLFVVNSDGGFINHNESAIKKNVKKYFISKADYWLSTGQKTNEYLEYYGAKKERIFIYPFSSIHENEIIPEVIGKKEKENLRNKLGMKEDKIILFVGQIIHRKGIDVLLKASVKLPKHYGFYIVGGTPKKEYLELKEKLKLKDNIHFIKFKTKKELKDYYKASDLFVLPTREDIWGLVVNEAMAYGLPVVTTNKCIAGLELIKDYENGFIIPSENWITLAEKINLILENKDLYLKMSVNSLKKIKEYTIENMAKKHFEIFQEIIRNNY